MACTIDFSTNDIANLISDYFNSSTTIASGKSAELSALFSAISSMFSNIAIPEIDSEKEKKLVVTPIESKYLVGEGTYAHEIPDVTDRDGNTLYGRWGFRLICEEEMIKEQVN